MNPSQISYRIKHLANEMGFIACGFSKVRRLDEEEENLKAWLNNGYHGKMAYMENHFEKRLDPSLLLPEAKSVISFLYNYYPAEHQNPTAPVISRYAYGNDYHKVMKDKMHSLIEKIKSEIGEFNYRVFVDSAPVMERQWAALSGLGWIGKNSLLLRKGVGSYFFIGNIICDLEIAPDEITTDHCGSCTACIDACPTDAIVQDGVIDGSKCISYLTIELKDQIPEEFREKTNNRVFGCDICQEVCPWNNFSYPNNESLFKPSVWLNWDKHEWLELDEVKFNELFINSAINRAGFKKLKENILFNQ